MLRLIYVTLMIMRVGCQGYVALPGRAIATVPWLEKVTPLHLNKAANLIRVKLGRPDRNISFQHISRQPRKFKTKKAK
ncbi:hypothetical protein EB796_017951 [Bugula neritina]|uniref:Secreted protein n=1 Tax=Bugula neritina TaxID=10212 RepID=A0A7J7JBV5_BUGNE|nr:hypothetical protein EB796_017951 [Bugula neritina]